MTILREGGYHQLPSGMVSDYMTSDVITITPETDVFEAADQFLKHYFRRLVVADENNHLLGQITRRDLLRVIKKVRKEEKKKIAPIL
jgi:predicted transcriptional regulator